MFRNLESEEKAREESVQEKVLVPRTYVRGRGAFLDVLEQERSPW